MTKQDYAGSNTFKWYDSPSSNNAPTIELAHPPKPVGGWIMPGSTARWATKFMAYRKPNWLVRWSMRCVFGWKWEDAA